MLQGCPVPARIVVQTWLISSLLISIYGL